MRSGSRSTTPASKTCPARLPLTHAFRLGKQEVNNARMAAKAKAEAEAKAAAEKKEA